MQIGNELKEILFDCWKKAQDPFSSNIKIGEFEQWYKNNKNKILALGKPEPLAKNKQTENICDENDKKTICNNPLSHECCNKHHKRI